MSRPMQLPKILMLVACLAPGSAAAQIEPVGKVEFSGPIEGSLNLSAVQVVGDLLALASDETTKIQMLAKTSPTSYATDRMIKLLPRSSTEIDIEALALDGETLYVLGSHSRARRRVRDDRSRAANRRRLQTLKLEATRDHLFRLDLDQAGGEPKISSTSLRSLLANHPVLHLFAQTPSKENGIDFEGLAVAEGRLYLGLRGPVLRGNYVPILSFAYDDIEDCAEGFTENPEDCRTLYVRLGGRGIRSLHRVSGGFLIVAGPMGDGDGSLQLYLWDGRDCVLDDGTPDCRLALLGELPTPEGAKAEGLAVLAEAAASWEILVVYDGAADGERFRVARP